MKKIYVKFFLKIIITVIIGVSSGLTSQAQPWLFDFGTGTGTANNANAGTGLTTFYSAVISPTTTTPVGGGTYRVRIGTGGGSLTNPNPGTTLGTGSEASLNATTGTSTNKFGVYDWSTPSNFLFFKSKIRTTSSSTGTLNFSAGINTIANDNQGFTSHYNNSLVSLRINYSGGAISSVQRRTSGTDNTITSSGFLKDTDQDFEVYLNNSASSTTYTRSGTTYTLNSQQWDLWVAGTKVSPALGWAKAGSLATGNLTGFAFFGESSTSNSAFIYLDDFEYSNALPSIPAFTVTFNNNGGTGSMTAQSASAATALTTNTFTRTGYTFTGWNTAADGSGTAYADGANYSFTADITLYAQWAINQYSVSYNGNGNDGGTAPATQNGNYNSSITLATNSGGLTKTGFTFNGWNTNAAGSGTHYNVGASFTIPAANTILYAEWVSTAPSINTTGSLTSVNTTYGTASGNTSFSVSASNLVANLVITPPVGFEISTSSTFVSSFNNGSPLSITPSGGTVPATTIYVRLAATTPAGTYSGNIGLASGAATATVATASSVVSPKALTIINLVGTDKVYDRTTTVVVTGTPAYSGLVNSETFSVSGTVSWAFPDANVGVGKTLVRTGTYNAPSANYTVTQPTVTASITAKALTVTGAAAQNKVYDGTNAATITGTLNGVISPDAVTLNGTGTFASVNVGTGISVTSTSTLGGAQAGNYSLTQPTGLTANITPAAPIFTTSTISLTVGGTYTLPGASISSTSGGTLSYSITGGGNATLAGTTLTGAVIGTETLTVNQAASGNYLAGSTTVLVNVSSITYVNGDFMTRDPGTWTNDASGTATWYKRVGGAWTVTTEFPNGSADNYTVYIDKPINVAVAAAVYATAKIYILSGGVVTYDKSGTPWTFRNIIIDNGGTLQANTRFTVYSGGNFEMKDGGNFIYNYSANTLSASAGQFLGGTENFSQNSNFIVKNLSGGDFITPTVIGAVTPNANNSYFGNIIVDYSGGENNFTLITSGTYTGANFQKAICNDLVFRTSNSSPPRIYQAATSYIGSANPLTIQGNFITEAAFAQSISFTTASHSTGSFYLKVNKDFIHNAPVAYYNLNSQANNNCLYYLLIGGNMTVGSNAKYIYRTSMNSLASIYLRLTGNLSVATTGEVKDDGSNTSTFGNFWFEGTALQTIDYKNPANNNKVAYSVRSNANVQLINQDLSLGTSSSFGVQGNATFDFGFNASNTALNITASSTGASFESFTLSTLKITSPDGITTTTGVGNVQVPASSRTYNQTANFWYTGRASQVTGNGLTVGSTVKNVYVNLLDNTIDLKLSNRIGIADGGKLEIQKGILIAEEAGPLDTDDKDFYGTGTLIMSDGEYRIGTITSDPATIYLPKLSKYGSYSLTGGTVNLNGNNAIQKLSGSPSYYNVKFSGANTLGAVTVSPFATDYKTISSATSVSNNITLEGTAIVFTDDKSLGGTTTSFTMNGTSRYITGGGVTKPDAGGAYSLASGSTIEFIDDAAKEIRLSGTGGNPVYSNIIVRGTKVGTSSASAGINFLAGGTFTVKTGGVFRVIPTAGFSNKTGLGTTALSNVAPSDPAVTLEAGSTISYFGAAQTITKAALTFPTTGNYQNLTISGSGLKTAPSADLIVLGNVQKDSTSEFKHNGGTVLLSGIAAQDVTANVNNTHELLFNNLRITNATGVEAKSNFGIYRTLSFDGVGKINLNSGDISLKSDALNTANVAQLTGSAAINYGTGRFIVERYIATNSHTRAWQFLSTPTQGTQSINAAWQEGNTPGGNSKPGYGTIINGAGAGFDGPTGVNIKTYLPATDIWDNGPSSTANNIFNANGWMVFVRGDRSGVASTSTVLRTRGQLFEPGNATKITPDDVNVPMGKYQSAGNPYASSIDIRALLKTNLTDEVYIWDPALGGSYGFGKYRTLTLVGSDYHVIPFDGTGSYPNEIVNRIQSGQAFFVKAIPSAAGKIEFTSSAKMDSSRVVTRGGGINHAELLRVDLFSKNTSGENELLDGAMAIFGDYSKGLDYHDGIKFMSSGENVGFRVKTAMVAVERAPSPLPGDTLYLELSGTRQVPYQWKVNTTNMDVAGRSAWLYDDYLKRSIPLSLDGETPVDFTVSNDPLSTSAHRFKIVFQKVAAPAPVKFISITATRNADRSINVKWKVENETNITGYTIERSADGRTFTGITNTASANQASYAKDDLSPLAQDNFYRIKASGLGGEITYSDIVKVAPLPTKAYISVYPNPVEGKTAQLIFANQPAGLYQVQVINNLGQVIFNSSVKVSGYNFVYPITLGAKTTQGNYDVKVLKEDGKVSVQKIIVN